MKTYNIHYTVVLGYDMKVSANSNDDAKEIAQGILEDIPYCDMKLEEAKIEVVRKEN